MTQVVDFAPDVLFTSVLACLNKITVATRSTTTYEPLQVVALCGSEPGGLVRGTGASAGATSCKWSGRRLFSEASNFAVAQRTGKKTGVTGAVQVLSMGLNDRRGRVSCVRTCGNRGADMLRHGGSMLDAGSRGST